MTLEEFAIEAGVEIVDCGEGWNGRTGYRHSDVSDTVICGFRKKNSAYKHWLKDTFGDKTSKAVIKLLTPHHL